MANTENTLIGGVRLCEKIYSEISVNEVTFCEISPGSPGKVTYKSPHLGYRKKKHKTAQIALHASFIPRSISAFQL